MSTLVVARTGSNAEPGDGGTVDRHGPSAAGRPRPGEVVETWVRSRSGFLLAHVHHPPTATALGAVLVLPPTVRGPGAIGAAAPELRRWCRGLAHAGYAVVRADWSGSGESGPTDRRLPAVARHLDDVRALVGFVRSQLGLEDVHVVGLGSGGRIAALATGDPYNGPVAVAGGERSAFSSVMLIPDPDPVPDDPSPGVGLGGLPHGKAYPAWQTRIGAVIPARGPRWPDLERYAAAAGATLLRAEDPHDPRHALEWLAQDATPARWRAWRPLLSAEVPTDEPLAEELLTLRELTGVLTRPATSVDRILVLLGEPGGSRRGRHSVALARRAAGLGLATLRLDPPMEGTSDEQAVDLYESALAALGERYDAPVCLAGVGRGARIALRVAAAAPPGRVAQVVAVDPDGWECPPAAREDGAPVPPGWGGWRGLLPYGLALALARRGRLLLPQVSIERAVGSGAACDLVFAPEGLAAFRGARGETGVTHLREGGADVCRWSLEEAAQGAPALRSSAEEAPNDASAVLARALSRASRTAG